MYLYKMPANVALDLTPSRSLRSLRGRKSAYCSWDAARPTNGPADIHPLDLPPYCGQFKAFVFG